MKFTVVKDKANWIFSTYGISRNPQSIVSYLVYLCLFVFFIRIAEIQFFDRFVQINAWLDIKSNWPVLSFLAVLLLFNAIYFSRQLAFYDGFIITYFFYYIFASEKFQFQSITIPLSAIIYYCLLFTMPVAKLLIKNAAVQGEPYLLKDDPLGEEDFEDGTEVIDRRQLAHHIATSLEFVRPERAAFVVGIEGEWGAGKSSFLRQLTNEFKEKRFKVMHFNPWYFANLDTLLNDFLEKLGNRLRISKKGLSHYKNLLQVSERGFFGTDLFSHFTASDDSVEDAKDSINAQLALRKKPIIVMIDEIDRLQREELYNLLRLIRVVADFRNIIYVVFYDKEYLSAAFESFDKPKTKGSYLDKIFQLNFSLPPYDKDELIKELLNKCVREIERKTSSDIKSSQLESMTAFLEEYNGHANLQIQNIASNSDGYRALFSNYRDIKRFMNNLFIRYFSIMYDVNFYDFFYLELMRNFFEKSFWALVNQVASLPTTDQPEDEANAFIFESNHDRSGDTADANTRQQSFTKISKALKTSIEANPFRFRTHFFKYVRFSLSDRQIDIKEFHESVSNMPKVAEMWSVWVKSGCEQDLSDKIKRANSLESQHLIQLLNVCISLYRDVSFGPTASFFAYSDRFSAYRAVVERLINDGRGYNNALKTIKLNLDNGIGEFEVGYLAFLYLEAAKVSPDEFKFTEHRGHLLSYLKSLLKVDFKVESLVYVLSAFGIEVRDNRPDDKEWLLENIYFDEGIAPKIALKLVDMLRYIESLTRKEFGDTDDYEVSRIRYRRFNSIFGDRAFLEENANFKAFKEEISDFIRFMGIDQFVASSTELPVKNLIRDGSSWAAGPNSIKQDGVAATEWEKFGIKFTGTGSSGSYTTSGRPSSKENPNIDLVWPANGTWEFASSSTTGKKDASRIIRSDGVSMTVSETSAKLSLTFSIDSASIGAGGGVAGTWVFEFSK